MNKKQYYEERCKNTRLVETELQGTNHFQILESVVGQLSDGVWESSSHMEPKWVFIDILLNPYTNKVEIRVSQNTCVRSCFFPKRWIWNPYLEKTDLEIKKYFARKIKTIINLEAKDKGKKLDFNLSNQYKMEYLGDWTQTVAEAVEVYNSLRK